MAHEPAASDEEFHWTICVARLILPASIHLQAPPNLSVDPTRLLDFGIDDFGGISPITADHVNPERAWPALAALAAVLLVVTSVWLADTMKSSGSQAASDQASALAGDDWEHVAVTLQSDSRMPDWMVRGLGGDAP